MSLARRVLPYLLGAFLAAGFHALAWGGLEGFTQRMDFNQALFEDFMGPYYTQGQELFESRRPVAGFLYTPFFALGLSAFRGVDPGLASWVWLALLGLGAVGCVLLPLAILGRLRPAEAVGYTFLAGVSLPLAHGLYWGQISAPLTALVLLAIWARTRGRMYPTGMALGVAASIKVYPAVFLAVPLLRREWRVVRAFVVSTLLLALLVPVLALGAADTLAFYDAVARTLRDASSSTWSEAPASQVLYAALGRRAGLHSGPTLWISVGVSLLLAAAALRFALAAARGGRHATSGALLFCAVPLVVAPSWPHYFAYLPFVTLVAWRDARGMLRPACVLAAAALSSAPVFRWYDDHERYFGQGVLAAANLLLLWALAYEERERGRGREHPDSGL